MTSILALGGAGAAEMDDGVVRRLLHAADDRELHVVVHREPGVVLAVARRPWELERDRATGLAVTRSCVVVADATLYHVEDLRGRLAGAGARAAGADASSLIAAAFDAWGDACMDRLEGDFAFAIWDRRTRRFVAARDHAGRRPLYLASIDGDVCLASALESVVAHPRFRTELDLGALGADAAGLVFGRGDATSWRDARAVSGGQRVRWSADGSLAVERYWMPRPAYEYASFSFDDAADALRALLVDSARERLDDGAATAVWMSGGRDSTAAFAAGQQAVRDADSMTPLVPASCSYPHGDSGREDELILDIAGHWGVCPRWVDTRPLGVFDGAVERAGLRAEPIPQPFESLFHALSERCREAGARVVFDGYGGDFLFQASPAYLADLLAAARLRTLVREWRGADHAGEGWRMLARWGVNPLLPPWVRTTLGHARGTPVAAPFERFAPPWMRQGFVREHGLVERARALGPDAFDGARDEREMRWCLTHPFYSRVNGFMGRLALAHDLELRSPLLDERVVALALARPREERSTRGDRKRLLRRAMRGLLPDSVLAPRPFKTGTQASFFMRGMRERGLAMLEALDGESMLGELGIVDPRALGRAVADHRAGRAWAHLESLYTTLQVELWLRARAGRLPDALFSYPTTKRYASPSGQVPAYA